jgi:hypothetical protein
VSQQRGSGFQAYTAHAGFRNGGRQETGHLSRSGASREFRSREGLASRLESSVA